MIKKSQKQKKPAKKADPNPDHREDFFKLLRKASQDQKEADKT